MTLLDKYPPQRLAAVSLLAVVMLMVIGFLIVPLINAALELREEKHELLFRLERYQRITDRKAMVKANAEKIKQANAEQSFFSRHKSEAMASADLQQVVRSAITDAGGELISTQVLPSKIEGKYIRVAIKIRMNGDIETLRSVLLQIESAIPFIMIDDLDIRPERGIRDRITRKLVPSNKMNISFQAAGFMGKE